MVQSIVDLDKKSELGPKYKDKLTKIIKGKYLSRAAFEKRCK